MDALSHLLSLYPVQTSLDTRCRGTTPYSMDHVERGRGTAPYHLIVEGGAVLHVAGRSPLPLLAGDMLVLPHGPAHTLHIGGNAADGASADVLCGQFHFGDAAGTLVSALPEVVLVRTAGKQEFLGLQALVNLLRDESVAARPGASAVVSHLASALLALILRAWLLQADTIPGLFALLADQRLAPVLQQMLTAPGKTWTLPQLAALCNMSRATFLRNFRKVSGGTPGEVLMHIRMAQAAQWLGQTHRGVAEVGAAVGYQSEAAFNRAFKRHMGEGPGQYRREVSAAGTQGDGDSSTRQPVSASRMTSPIQSTKALTVGDR